MKQTTRLLLQIVALVIVAGALLLYAFFGVHEEEKKVEKKKADDAQLVALSKAGAAAPDGGRLRGDVIRLTVTAKGGATVLERTADTDWVITSPVHARVDKVVVDAMVSQLQTSRFTRVLTENADDATLAKYGLAPPKFSLEALIEYGTGGQRETVKLEGGMENTFDGSTYMRRGTERTVRLAEGGVRFALERSTDELRDKQLFAVPEEQVAKVSVKTANNEWVLARQPDGSWVVTTPAWTQLADTTQVTALFGSMRSEAVTSFLPDTLAARGEANFDKPLIDAQMVLDGGEKVRMRVSQSQWDAGSHYVALREDAQGSSLATASVSLPGRFDRNARDFVDHGVLRVKKELVTRLVLHGGGGPDVVLEKPSADAGAESWHLVAPKVAPVKIFKVTSALWQLASLKSASVVEEKPKGLAQYGLDGTARSVALVGADGQELARLVLGKDVPGKAGSLYALGTTGDVVELEAARLGELPWKPEDVLDEPAAKDAGSAK